MGAKVIINGCVGGVDQYAFGKRLFGKPEQTLMIFDGTDMYVVSARGIWNVDNKPVISYISHIEVVWFYRQTSNNVYIVVSFCFP